MISAPDGDEWSASRPGRFTPGKETSVLSGYEGGWVPEPVSTLYSIEIFVALAGNRTPAVQPVASHYTD
jgi:hypothetical protein